MKKMCILLAAIFCLQVFPITAQTGEEFLFFEDFETEDTAQWESIGGTPSFVCEEENHVYSVSAQDFFEKESMSGYRNYSYSFRMKLDYRDEEGNFGNTWPTLRFRVSDDSYYNAYFYNKVGAEEIGVQKFVGTAETWLATASPKLTEDNDSWVLMKIELAGQTVRIYYDDMKEALISFTDSEGEAPMGGGFCFIANGVSKFYLDDLKVERCAAQTEEAEPIVKTEDRELIHFYDYEHQSGEAIRTEGKNHYLCAEEEASSAECEDFVCRFQWRKDYYPYGENASSFSFGDGYAFELDSSLKNGAVILKKGTKELARKTLCLADYDKVWTAVGFSAEKNSISFYWNDMEEPLFTHETEETVGKGAVCLRGGDLDNWYLASAYRFRPIEIVSSVTAEEENVLRWTLSCLSHAEKKQTGTAIAAAFAKGSLCAKSVQKAEFPAKTESDSEQKNKDIIFELPKIEGAEWYFFLWNGMTPLADSFQMGSTPTRSEMPPKSGQIPNVQWSAEAKNESFQISGTVDDASQNITFLLQPLGEGNTYSYDDMIFLAQLTPQKNGCFSCEVPAEKALPEGDYRIYAASDDRAAEFVDTEFLREGNVSEFLRQWNQAETAEKLRELLLAEENFRYARRLGLRPQLFADLKQEHLQLAVTQRVLEQKKEAFTEENVGELFAPHLAFALLKKAESGKEVKKIAEAYPDLFSLPALYTEAEENVRTEAMNGICKGLKDGAYDSVSEALADVEANVILASIYLANYKDVPQLLETYREELSLDLGLTESLSNAQKTTAYQEMNGTRCYSCSEFARLYQSAIENAKTPPPTKKPSSPSGGGGGGGKTTITVEPLPTATSTPTPLPAKQPLYADVSEGHWAREAVEYLSDSERAIVGGYEDGNFYPDRHISRAEFVKLLVNAFRLGQTEEKISFSDVSSEAWYAPYVLAAAQNGIVLGNDGCFSPQAEITRQDMAVMLYRTAQKKMLPLEQKRACAFSDESSIAAYAEKAVKALSEAEILSGVGENCFKPRASATRAQAAKMIYEMIK